jgi:hypothetical protein
MPNWGRRNARFLHIAYIIVTGLLAFTTALLVPADGIDPLRHFPWIAALSIAAVGSTVWIAGVWTATGVYALIFWCFHFGLVAVLGSGYVGVEEISVWDLSWLLSPHALDAALLALTGALALACGASIVFVTRGRARPSVGPAPPTEPAHALGAAGSILVLGSIAAWSMIVVATGGIGGFFASYGEYRQATGDLGAVLGVIWLVLGCGFVLSMTGRSGWLRMAAGAAFAAFAVVALPLGLRGEVMFRGVAALVGAARCGRRLSTRNAIVLGLTLLAVIPIVREVRQTGLSGLSHAVVEPRLYEGLAEMGASLHPVEKVVRWHAEGEPFEKGRSYWAPIERAAARLLPGITVVAADDDLRITNVLVTDRVGAIGFSPVAEAFRNFGPLGVAVVLGLLGALMAGIDTIRDRRTAVLTLAILYVPLLVNIRNSFVPVPAHCAAGIALILALAAMRHVLESVVGRPYARPAYIRSQV